MSYHLRDDDVHEDIAHANDDDNEFDVAEN